MAQNASRATPEASRKGRETVCFVLCTCGVKTWHLVAKITTHDNSRQPSWLFEIPVSVTVNRASWTASTNRLLARSCFSIDLFAPKPSFTVCAWVHIQLQTTYARLLKYAWADAQTHMHARTPAQLAAPPGSHTPWRTDVSKPVGKQGGGELLFCNLQNALPSMHH